MAASPTQRSLQECRKRGWPAYVTEKWIPKVNIRKDAFGFGDILCLDGGPGAALIQCTSTSNLPSRVAKILDLDVARRWLEDGNRIYAWGWAKRGAAGKRKLWTLKERQITLKDFPADGR